MSGDCGEILTSRNGEHWATPTSGSSDILTGVVCGDYGFVAVGDKGTILTSPDGLVWTQRNSGTDQTLFGVAYGNGTFVVLGDNSTILTSNDGVKWTPVAIGPEAMESIAFGNGVFMGTSIVTDLPDFPGEKVLQARRQTMVSTDGKNWHEVRHPYPPEGQAGIMTHAGHPGGTTALTFGGGLFIAASAEGIYTSKDGNSWNPSVEPYGFKSCYCGAAYGNGLFVAVGNGSTISTDQWDLVTGIAISKDANTWTFSQSPPSRLLWGYIHDRSFSINFGIYLASTDEKTWTFSGGRSINGLVRGNEVVFYSGETGEKLSVLATEDGIAWTRLVPRYSDRPTPVVAANISNARKSEAVPNNIQNNAILKSENGVVIELNGQAYKLNLTTAIGQPMEVQASTDLQSWVTLTTITNSGGILNFVDPDAKNYPQRFYRLMLR